MAERGVSGELGENLPVAIAEIAETMALSRNTVVKVMRFAVQQGRVIAVRGCTGGLMLARPASDFRLACGLVPALAKGEKAFWDALNEQTLADLHYGSLPDAMPPNGVIRIAEAA